MSVHSFLCSANLSFVTSCPPCPRVASRHSMDAPGGWAVAVHSLQPTISACMAWLPKFACLSLATGFVATVRLALPHLRHQYQPAILVTTGGTGLDDPASNQMSAQNKLDALVIQAALKRKLVGLLHAELQPQGVYVGEQAL